MHHRITTTLILVALMLGATTLAAQSPAIELEKPVRLKVGDAFIDSGRHIGYSSPVLRDYDGDGKLDLLVGNFRGHIQLFKNVGTAKAPSYEEGGLLEVNGKPLKINNW